MRIKAITLTWFRGAADPVSLEPMCKSVVVYGVNGSGKSSFVDAVEYVLKSGKIGHLAHEYSGKHQEKGVPNTHKPQDRKTEIAITFQDDSAVTVEINPNGTATSTGTQKLGVGTWDYRRTVLRQDEVSAFIHDTKGGKYSALLPLLGLHQLEIAAENLRQLAKGIEHQSRLKEINGYLKYSEQKRKATFGADTDDHIHAKVADLHAKYCPSDTTATEPAGQCAAIAVSLATRTAHFSSEQKRYLTLRSAAEVDLQGVLAGAREANLKLADTAEPLITERLEVLQRAAAFASKVERDDEVACPACGRTILAGELQAHVTADHERLQEAIATFDSWKSAVGALCDGVTSLRVTLSKNDLSEWRASLAAGMLGPHFAYLDSLNVEALRASCGENDLAAVESNLLPLIAAATDASKKAPPDVQELAQDGRLIETAKGVLEAKDMVAAAGRSKTLMGFIASLEHGVREEIRERSITVIDAISADIQAMWSNLHPGEPIAAVRLYVPKDADKAIDIGLKFYGKDQDSPRLTLSEGYRNSLGLCIFLAMAKRDADKDRPLILDDVAVSLDRNHRGMIVELLEKEFSGRQVILLTHDRGWYAELRQQLDLKRWDLKALLPYETPDRGIRWSHKTTTFDDARAHLKDRPDSAGNDARKIMDIELGLAAERLQIRLPYLSGEKNDRRMAHDFLERMIADGKKCFQRKKDGEYIVHQEALDAFEQADRLLLSWGNKASHTFDIVRPEATKLIDVCETALGKLKCSTCGRNLWFANAQGAEWVQCECSEIRWRYGKG